MKYERRVGGFEIEGEILLSGISDANAGRRSKLKLKVLHVKLSDVILTFWSSSMAMKDIAPLSNCFLALGEDCSLPGDFSKSTHNCSVPIHKPI
jgi:hypothetical protein